MKVSLILTFCLVAQFVSAETRIRIMPANRSTFAVGQLFDVRVEATGIPGGPAPRGLHVFIDRFDVSGKNILEPGTDGERGAGGTGATQLSLPAHQRAENAPAHTTNFLIRDFSFKRSGIHVIKAVTEDGSQTSVEVEALQWEGKSSAPRAQNIILLLGDGMGVAHRTAARIVMRGYADGRPNGLLAMDTMPFTAQIMTASLNSLITDSAPGTSSYTTGNKSNNNQEGVFPDNTPDYFDNPRVEYIGEFLRRIRGEGFHLGVVTTSDVTDATPAANAVHTSRREAYDRIADRFFDERMLSGISVLMGGGSSRFERQDRNLTNDFRKAGFVLLRNGKELQAQLEAPQPPRALLGLFSPVHMPVAFDKVGAGRYSGLLPEEKRDVPMLEDMARLAIRSLSTNSPQGFYLMIEGASIDKQAHAADAERTIWDTIEFDRAVQVALDFAARTNTDRNSNNDTLVIVTADHECGGLALIGVGNELYSPQKMGKAVRDYAAVFRFEEQQDLNLYTNYAVDDRGFPVDPDPSRKLLVGWAAAPDRYENWISNRFPGSAATGSAKIPKRDEPYPAATANKERDSSDEQSDNETVSGQKIPGFLVHGVIENGENACLDQTLCPGDTSSVNLNNAGHTMTDIVLSAAGTGATQFTGTFDNTAVFIKMLRANAGTYGRLEGQ